MYLKKALQNLVRARTHARSCINSASVDRDTNTKKYTMIIFSATLSSIFVPPIFHENEKLGITEHEDKSHVVVGYKNDYVAILHLKIYFECY